MSKSSDTEVLKFAFKAMCRLSEVNQSLIPKIASRNCMQVVGEKLDSRSESDFSDAL